jgi:AcrR family transcriptional regulator
MATVTAEKASARERLLAAANELFYAEGVHTVGIDRIIERAGVAKATLYTTFGSKDELVRAYLQSRYDARRQRITDGIAQFQDPRDRLLAVFDALAESLARPSYRGCAFVNASAESTPGSVAEQVSNDYREWMLSLLVDLAREAGASHPDTLARRLIMLYDGAGVMARMDQRPSAANDARAIAEMLLDAAASE